MQMIVTTLIWHYTKAIPRKTFELLQGTSPFREGPVYLTVP